MKIDQIAFYAANEEIERSIKRNLGLEDAVWIEDRVEAESVIPDHSPTVRERSVGKLLFNYDLGIELEILRYVSGSHWHHFNPNWNGQSNSPNAGAFISHVGIHLADDEEFPAVNWKLVQETWTSSHTSEYLTKEGSPGFGRKYHYRIYEITPGTYMKYIQRRPMGK